MSGEPLPLCQQCMPGRWESVSADSPAVLSFVVTHR